MDGLDGREPSSLRRLRNLGCSSFGRRKVCAASVNPSIRDDDSIAPLTRFAAWLETLMDARPRRAPMARQLELQPLRTSPLPGVATPHRKLVSAILGQPAVTTCVSSPAATEQPSGRPFSSGLGIRLGNHPEDSYAEERFSWEATPSCHRAGARGRAPLAEVEESQAASSHPRAVARRSPVGHAHPHTQKRPLRHNRSRQDAPTFTSLASGVRDTAMPIRRPAVLSRCASRTAHALWSLLK